MSIFLAFLTLVLFAGLPGCSKRASGEGATIEGKVTFNGQPLPGGRLTLHPKNGEPGYTAELTGEGTFLIPDLKPMGEVIVTVDNLYLKGAPSGLDPAKMIGPKGNAKDAGEVANATAKMPKGNPMDAQTKGPKLSYVAIPAKYADKTKSDLKGDIKSGKNELKFDLVP